MPIWKKVLLVVYALLGLALGVFVVARFGGVSKALEVVGDVGWAGLGIYILNASMTLLAPAVGWWILLRAENRVVPLRTAVKANLMGFPLNFFMPSMYLGAEPLKTYYVSAVHGIQKRNVLATIIVAKFQELGGHILVMLAAATVALWRLEFTRRQEFLLIGSMVIITAAFGLTLYAVLGKLKPIVRVINFLAIFKGLRRRMARLRTRADEMEHLIHEAFTKRWKTFLVAQAVTTLSAVSIVLRPAIFFGFTRERTFLPLEHLCAIFLITNIINFLPHMPGALGFFEAGMMGFFAASGIGRENAAAFSMISRTADLFLILTGIWLIVHTGMQATARRVAEGKEQMSLEEAGEPEKPTSA
jgi:hypothetical protein